MVQVAGVDQRAGLVVEDAQEFGVGVAQGGDGDAGGEVEVPPVFEVVEVGAVGFGEDGGRARVSCDHVGCVC